MRKELDKKPEAIEFDPLPLEKTLIGYASRFPEKFYEVAEVEESYFAKPICRKLWRVFRRLYAERGEAGIRVVTLVTAEAAREGVPEADANLFMVECRDHAPETPGAIDKVVEKLTDHHVRRSVASAAAEIGVIATDASLDADDVASKAQEALHLATRATGSKNIVDLSAQIEAELRRMEAIEEGRISPTTPGITTGFNGVDKQLGGGFHSSELIIIAGRPGHGKSALAGGLALAMEQESPGVLFSLEMDTEMWATRVLSSLANVDLQKARQGLLNPPERAAYMEATRSLMGVRIKMEDSGGVTMPKIAATVQRLYHEDGIRWVIVDYLQLIDHRQRANESTNDAVARTSKALKALARGMKIPVVALAQLNRSSEREKRRPRLSDLRDSGSLEQDADVVMFIHRESAAHKEDAAWLEENEHKLDEAELIIAKQRNGPPGIIKLRFNDKCAAFTDWD